MPETLSSDSSPAHLQLDWWNLYTCWPSWHSMGTVRPRSGIEGRTGLKIQCWQPG